MKTFTRNIAVFGLFALAGQSLAQNPTANYIGPDGGMWDVPSNWDTGLVPDENTNVVVQLKGVVVPQGMRIKLRDAMISSFGSVETKEGSSWEVINETILAGGSLIHRATLSKELTGTLVVGSSTSTEPGLLTLNPSPKSKRVIVLQSSAQLSMGLGGSTAASEAMLGMGTYATLTGEDITLGGSLSLASYYGFNPTPGQQFDIIKSSRSTTGQFAGLGEGDLAGNLGGVDLRISYVGGDGDDVVLTAVPEPTSMLVLGLGLVGLARRRKR